MLHNLQGHLSVFQFLILVLNVDKDVSSLKSLGKIFEILTPKEVIVSVPYLTELTFASVESFRISKIVC